MGFNCESCGVYMVGDAEKGYLECKDKECPPDSKVTADLVCLKCPERMVQDISQKHKCILKTCTNERDFVTEKSNCEPCPEYTFPTLNK